MLFYLLIGLAMLMLFGAMSYAYTTTHDALHPLIYLSPLFVYAYIFKPLSLGYVGVLESYFDPSQLMYVQIVNTLGLAAFCLGAMRHAHLVTGIRVPAPIARAELEKLLTPAVRQRVREIAWVMGGLAVATYWVMIFSVGGLGVAYGSAKGGVSATSGYVGEMPMLCLSAIGLLYFAWTGQRVTIMRLLTLLLVASPLIVHGLLGARRGPTFMVMAALLIGGYLVSPKRPRLATVFATVFLLGILLLFLVNNRQRIFIGGAALDEWADAPAQASGNNINSGEDWIFSSGMMLASDDSSTHYWGGRLLANLFIRPIPRQVWPDKYQDIGLGWMENQDEMAGMADNEWLNAVGWLPQRGAAAGFIADLYLEFSYLGFVFCYGFGWLYSYLWRRSVIDRGGWSILYLFAAILSIYVPTQSISAWLYRFVFLSVPTMTLWHILVQPVIGIRAGATPLVLSRPKRRRFSRPTPPGTGPLPQP